MPSDPNRHAIGPHQLYCPGRKFIFQHFIINCHCRGRSCRVCEIPSCLAMRVSCSGVKIEGTKKANNPRRSISYTKSSVARTSSSVSPGLPTISVIIGNQLFLFATSNPFSTTLGQSSIEKGTPLLGMICLAMRTEPVSRPISGVSAFFFGCELSIGR